MGTRPLEFPRSQCIAQTVVQRYLYRLWFYDDSCGYRPGRPAHQAPDVGRQRGWGYAWALGLDIKKFFGSIELGNHNATTRLSKARPATIATGPGARRSTWQMAT